jgi:hypothetical protein
MQRPPFPSHKTPPASYFLRKAKIEKVKAPGREGGHGDQAQVRDRQNSWPI